MITITFHRATVKLLLEQPQWKEMMKKCDDSKLQEPLKNLIVEMPGKIPGNSITHARLVPTGY